MESQRKAIDTFQIVGFAVSTTVAIVLVVAQVDPMQATIIGLMLAIVTQLFDLQLRHTASEERLLQANALSETLYRDPELLGEVRQMVEDYYSVQNGWFELFRRRAEDALSDCHRILHAMAGGTMEPPPRSPFTLSVTGFGFAQKSLKQVTDFAAIKDAVEGLRGWYMKSWSEVAGRGVQMTMVLVLSRGDLERLEHEISQIHGEAMSHATYVAMPHGTYVALSDELPPELDENYLIVDDRVVSFFERRADGTLGEKTISIVPIEVERMVKRFDQMLRYARRSEDVFGEAGAQAPSA